MHLNCLRIKKKQSKNMHVAYKMSGQKHVSQEHRPNGNFFCNISKAPEMGHGHCIVRLHSTHLQWVGNTRLALCQRAPWLWREGGVPRYVLEQTAGIRAADLNHNNNKRGYFGKFTPCRWQVKRVREGKGLTRGDMDGN